MTAYYNEFDPAAAQWLRNLIKAGHLPPGDVDERSIKDVRADELVGYVQCHFFAGIGGWALAARLAGWPDDREIWTGSCPCQPFSVAGKGAGAADARHLWPDFFRLISARRPACVMGEQVAAAVGKDWFDGVRTDLESIGYVGRGVAVPACSVNAPHRRDRLWFVAGAMEHAESERGDGRQDTTRTDGRIGIEAAGCDVEYADKHIAGEERQQRSGELLRSGCNTEGGAGAFPDAAAQGSHACAHAGIYSGEEGAGARDVKSIGYRAAWDASAWVIGHDGKARRVGTRVRRLADGLSAGMAGLRTGQTGTEIQEEEIEMIPLLAHGVRGRTAKLKGFGNAIVPQVAAEVIAAWMECYP